MVLTESIPRLVGSSVGLCGFTVSVLGGLAVENDGGTVLSRALPAMVVCYVVGAVLGLAGQRCVQEHIENYRKNRPVREAEMEELERRLVDLAYADRG